MVRRYRDFTLRVFEITDSTTDNWARKFSCEIFSVDDVAFQNCLDKPWLSVKRTDVVEADVAEALCLFLEYVKKLYPDLMRAAKAPLDNVMEDAFRRSFGGWTLGQDSEVGFEEDLRKSLMEDLGL